MAAARGGESGHKRGFYRYDSRMNVTSIVTRYSLILPLETLAFCSVT